MAKILVVEDDIQVRNAVQDCLTAQKHTVEVSVEGLDGLHRVRSYDYDLIILDWQLPNTSGVEICRQFRQNGGLTPVLMLTGRTSIDDKESGFDAGADDYLTKPFDVRELNARVRALLRRPTQLSKDMLCAGPIAYDCVATKVTRNGDEIRLLPREYAVLEFFLRNKNRFFQADDLLNSVWSSESEATAVAVRQCIKRLREKIDLPDQPSIICNRPGLGYGIVEE